MRSVREVKRSLRDHIELLSGDPSYQECLEGYIEDLMLVTLISMSLYPYPYVTN